MLHHKRQGRTNAAQLAAYHEKLERSVFEFECFYSKFGLNDKLRIVQSCFLLAPPFMVRSCLLLAPRIPAPGARAAHFSGLQLPGGAAGLYGDLVNRDGGTRGRVTS